jgi:hypothetical protein
MPKHREAARLYLYGPPEIRGKWNECARQAGFTRIPRLDSKVMVVALDESEQDSPIDSDLAKLDELLASGNPSWPDLAAFAKRVMGKVALGLVDASPGQVASLREIVARAEGKIGQLLEETDDDVVHVVVLPAIDTNMGPVIDIDSLGATDDEETIPGLTLRQAMAKS